MDEMMDFFGKCEMCGTQATFVVYDCAVHIRTPCADPEPEVTQHRFCDAHKRAPFTDYIFYGPDGSVMP